MTEPEATDESIAQPTMPWPFPDDVFPKELGAAVTRDVLSGKAPALQFVHFDDGYWGVVDGHHVPSVRNLEPTHLRHVLELDGSLEELATLPPGYQADRDAPGQAWIVAPIDTRPNPRLVDRIRDMFDHIRFGDH